MIIILYVSNVRGGWGALYKQSLLIHSHVVNIHIVYSKQLISKVQSYPIHDLPCILLVEATHTAQCNDRFIV